MLGLIHASWLAITTHTLVDTDRFGRTLQTIYFVERRQKCDQNGRMDEFARKLRERADELGVSNAELARRCGLGERQYAYYINGQREPNLRTLVKIARVLNTSADQLLGLTDPQPPTERARLLDRLKVAASSLTDGELRTIVTQTEALAIPRPKKTDKRIP